MKLAILFLIGIVYAASAETNQFNIHGIKLGITKVEFEKIVRRTSVEDGTTIRGVKNIEEMKPYFYPANEQQKLGRIEFIFSEDLDPEAALIKAYGTPKTNQSTVITDNPLIRLKRIARREEKTLTWTRNNETLVLDGTIVVLDCKDFWESRKTEAKKARDIQEEKSAKRRDEFEKGFK